MSNVAAAVGQSSLMNFGLSPACPALPPSCPALPCSAWPGPTLPYRACPALPHPALLYPSPLYPACPGLPCTAPPHPTLPCRPCPAACPAVYHGYEFVSQLLHLVYLWPSLRQGIAVVQAVGVSSPEGTLLTTGSSHRQRALVKSGSSKALEGWSPSCPGPETEPLLTKNT